MDDSFRAYKRKLAALEKEVIPRVIAETINQVAGFAHVQSARNVRSRFVNRNAYTERSLRFYKANPKPQIWKINAISGSISDYMDEQDAGGYRMPKKGRKAPVAALAARGGNRTAVVRKKYKAGSLGQNQFIGAPRGSGRPAGVYERYGRGKSVRMIRNLEADRVKIKATRWHRDAMEHYATRQAMTGEFVRQAQAELVKLASK